MSDAAGGSNSPHVQVAGQRRHYETTTHLRRGHRSQLEPTTYNAIATNRAVLSETSEGIAHGTVSGPRTGGAQ
jgi:hypothetical protein